MAYIHSWNQEKYKYPPDFQAALRNLMMMIGEGNYYNFSRRYNGIHKWNKTFKLRHKYYWKLNNEIKFVTTGIYKSYSTKRKEVIIEE